MKVLTRVLKAVSDPTRLMILKLLEEGDFCVCEITQALSLAQPTVSRHLRILEESGLVYSRRKRQRIDYSLAGPEAGSPGKEILAFVKGQLEDDPRVRELRERCRSIRERSKRSST